ncbi:MAG TPA: ABC transporter substrate-binding protein [Alphaproteobacteria bacterium]|nr:ABC transporter substrate-binding protein [Alphaproteobacteria bacterium]
MRLISLCAKGLAVALLLMHGIVQAAELKKIQFNMSWLPQGSMAGVIVAADKGFYREVGLDVALIRGFGGIRTANELDQGLFEFAYVDPLAAILNRANGGHVRLIAPINARLPAGLCFVRERHRIAAPADLAGLVVGGGQNSPVQALLPIWLKRNKVDPAQVKIMRLDPSVVVPSLIEGKIDAAECWKGNSVPLFEQQAREANLTIGMISYADFGFEIHGSGIGASDRTIASDPDLARRFIQATMRGYAYTATNIDEALALTLKRYPVLEPEVTRAQIVETAQLLGKEFDPDKMERAIDLVRESGNLAGNVQASDIFTSQFLPQP